jgi:hypothetical protein
MRDDQEFLREADCELKFGLDQLARVYYAHLGRPPTIEEIRDQLETVIAEIKKGSLKYDPVLGSWVRPGLMVT